MARAAALDELRSRRRGSIAAESAERGGSRHRRGSRGRVRAGTLEHRPSGAACGSVMATREEASPPACRRSRERVECLLQPGGWGPVRPASDPCRAAHRLGDWRAVGRVSGSAGGLWSLILQAVLQAGRNVGQAHGGTARRQQPRCPPPRGRRGSRRAGARVAPAGQLEELHAKLALRMRGATLMSWAPAAVRLRLERREVAAIPAAVVEVARYTRGTHDVIATLNGAVHLAALSQRTLQGRPGDEVVLERRRRSQGAEAPTGRRRMSTRNVAVAVTSRRGRWPRLHSACETRGGERRPSRCRPRGVRKTGAGTGVVSIPASCPCHTSRR